MRRRKSLKEEIAGRMLNDMSVLIGGAFLVFGLIFSMDSAVFGEGGIVTPVDVDINQVVNILKRSEGYNAVLQNSDTERIIKRKDINTQDPKYFLHKFTSNGNFSSNTKLMIDFFQELVYIKYEGIFQGRDAAYLTQFVRDKNYITNPNAIIVVSSPGGTNEYMVLEFYRDALRSDDALYQGKISAMVHIIRRNEDNDEYEFKHTMRYGEKTERLVWEIIRGASS